MPKSHQFSYKLFLMYLDLDELPTLFDRFWLWSSRRPNLAWFKREDHLGSNGSDLAEAVREKVSESTGIKPEGPVRLLTNLRFFGYGFNPVSFYYCFNRDGSELVAIVAEVNNTPWGDQHVYVLPVENGQSVRDLLLFKQSKAFHVSPFMPMDMEYEWRLSRPAENLSVHIANHQDDAKVFDATMKLAQLPITSKRLAWLLVSYPLMPFKVLGAIYFEALRLYFKKIPFISHPDQLEASARVNHK